VKQLALIAAIALYASAEILAQNKDANKKKKTPHATIVVRPGPPVKPTQTANPNGPQKSDWGDSVRAGR